MTIDEGARLAQESWAWATRLSGVAAVPDSAVAAAQGPARAARATGAAADRELAWHMALSPFGQALGAAAAAGPPAQPTEPQADAGPVAERIRAQAEACAQHAGTAFVRTRSAAAVAQARALDALPAAARAQRPLLGLAYARKDMFHRAGEATECGSRILRGHVSDLTATVLERLDAAGAIDLGALHMAEFAMSPTGFNAHLGHGRNPWSAAHVSGGSSSGSGVAVAARLVGAALGSDTGGSVRLPAAICGVTGLKPTQHLVSVHGVMPLAPSLDCVGFLAPSAHDCARLLSAVSGPDPHDPACLDRPRTDYAAGIDTPLDGAVHVAVPRLPADAPASDEVRTMLAAVVEQLRAQGVRTTEVALPDLAELGLLCTLVLGAEAASMHRRWLAERPQDYGEQVRRRLERGLLYPAAHYVDALRLRPLLLQRFLAQCLPGDAQALVLPVLPHAVPTIAETTAGSEEEIEQRFGHFSFWTRAINYLGVPALALPAGRTGNGLPNGVQLVGRPCGERALLRIGHHYQGATDWHLRTPHN
jgi:aspartyl-tRNA(Asn)/glutamyl-tRNA(Gln) amidotransferase subunit A